MSRLCFDERIFLKGNEGSLGNSKELREGQEEEQEVWGEAKFVSTEA